jgi:flavin reductase (DIM6/NTAB) family NADH-FMN oxidoreductase RutF
MAERAPPPAAAPAPADRAYRGPVTGDSGGSSLHYGNPWADPEPARDPIRRVRGRLPAPITIWTAGGPGGTGPADVGRTLGLPGTGEWAGLTVSSVMLAQGEPARLAGLIGPDTDLADELQATGTFVVHVLNEHHRRLAQHFAGILPAPDEDLSAEATPHGPHLRSVDDRLGCRVQRCSEFGWSLLVEAVIEEATLAPFGPGAGLAWYRGQLHRLASPR